MKLDQLFEAESPKGEATRLMRQWRDHIAEKFSLTLDTAGTNAANGFPVVRKDGVWYGARFLPRGGWGKEADRLAPIAVRTKGAVKYIAKELAKLAKEGREIRISSSSKGNSDAKYWQQVGPVDETKIEDFMLNHLDDVEVEGGKVQRIFWWIRNPEGANDITTVSIDCVVRDGDVLDKRYGLPYRIANGEYAGKIVNAGVIITLPKPAAKKLAAALTKYKQGHNLLPIVKDMFEFVGQKLPNNIQDRAVVVDIGRVVSYLKRVSLEEVKPLLGKYIAVDEIENG